MLIRTPSPVKNFRLRTDMFIAICMSDEISSHIDELITMLEEGVNLLADGEALANIVESGDTLILESIGIKRLNRYLDYYDDYLFDAAVKVWVRTIDPTALKYILNNDYWQLKGEYDAYRKLLEDILKISTKKIKKSEDKEKLIDQAKDILEWLMSYVVYPLDFLKSITKHPKRYNESVYETFEIFYIQVKTERQ